MDNDYAIFRKFSSIAEAKEMETLLNENGIETIIADNIPPVDITFSGSTLLNEYEIRLKQEDFKKAEEILPENAGDILEQVEKDYYLFKFTDEELYEILLKSDEWSAFDYTLAQKILEDRGKTIDKNLLNSLKNQRIEDLAKPEGNQKSWIIGGYIFAIVGGFLGLIIGYSLWASKKTLPNGEKVYSYSEKDRQHGKNIFYIGLIVFPLSIISRFLDVI